MYPAYPSGTQLPQHSKPPAPPSVRNAVKTMYAGAAVTIIGVVIEIVTIGVTKTAIEKRSPDFTASQVNTAEHALIIGFVVSGLIAVAAWIFHARACQDGKSWAPKTGTGLFVLCTLDALIAIRSPVAVAVKAWWPVVWLAGLVAVIFLWQRPSTAFFNGTPQT